MLAGSLLPCRCTASKRQRDSACAVRNSVLRRQRHLYHHQPLLHLLPLRLISHSLEQAGVPASMSSCARCSRACSSATALSLPPSCTLAARFSKASSNFMGDHASLPAETHPGRIPGCHARSRSTCERHGGAHTCSSGAICRHVSAVVRDSVLSVRVRHAMPWPCPATVLWLSGLRNGGATSRFMVRSERALPWWDVNLGGL